MDTEDHSLAEATQELAPPPEAAVLVPLARTKNVFRLGYGGYLHYAPSSKAKGKSTVATVVASSEDEPAAAAVAAPFDPPQKNGGGEKKESPHFYMIGRQLPLAIGLYPNQITRLIHELPNAYQAQQAGLYYKFVVAKNTQHLVALETSHFNGKVYLFLKKYFNPNAKKQQEGNESAPAPPTTEFQGNEEEKWYPTRSVITLDPARDDPEELLEFVLTCCH